MERWAVHAAWFVALCVSLWVSAWLARARERMAGRRAVQRGKRGEDQAAGVLKRLGYRIVRRQANATYELLVDGTRREMRAVADFIVERGGERWVAEAKTGVQAVRVEHEGTRRQLLEYQLAFGVSRVLLVDGDRGEVQELVFPITPLPKRVHTPALAWLVLGAALGALVVWWSAGGASAPRVAEKARVSGRANETRSSSVPAPSARR